jgi:two-component system sensor histidine kinase YesM
MVDEGKITIRIFEDGEDVRMEVEDNGIGMSDEQVAELFVNDGTDNHGIGVKNVNDRIKIYFGDKYGISVKSELDVGTCVSIRIPKITEESKYEK